MNWLQKQFDKWVSLALSRLGIFGRLDSADSTIEFAKIELSKELGNLSRLLQGDVLPRLGKLQREDEKNAVAIARSCAELGKHLDKGLDALRKTELADLRATLARQERESQERSAATSRVCVELNKRMEKGLDGLRKVELEGLRSELARLALELERQETKCQEQLAASDRAYVELGKRLDKDMDALRMTELEAVRLKIDKLLKEREERSSMFRRTCDEIRGKIEENFREVRTRQLHDVLPWLTNLQSDFDFIAARANRCYEDRYGNVGINYLQFENCFRGSESDIKDRFKIYLPHFRGHEQDVLVDVACGRGEMLELLTENGFKAKGVDLCHEMVEHCRSKGLDVAEADAFDYLSGLEDACLGGIFLGQVVEHLGGRDMIRLLRLCQQKLAKGGVMILETLNPEKLAIFNGSFYMDLTHVFPIHPQVVDFVLKTDGWSDSKQIDTCHPEQDYAWKGVK